MLVHDGVPEGVIGAKTGDAGGDVTPFTIDAINSVYNGVASIVM